ncbi:sigma 54-interacting transcriptional regulator [Clostridium sp.]|uniref:sigma-54 interaction domain-containing protein n=1 Tax=Clostridium sp. TaxID=1506 RepID=UPI003216EE16
MDILSTSLFGVAVVRENSIEQYNLLFEELLAMSHEEILKINIVEMFNNCEDNVITVNGRILKYEFVQCWLFVIDISKEKYLIKEVNLLKSSLDSIDAVINSSYDGIYITDGSGNTLRVNEAYEKISGIKRELILGKNMRKLVEDGTISVSATMMALERRVAITLEQEYSTGKQAVVTSNPVFYEGTDEINIVVTNVRDVTEIVALKDEIKEKEYLANKYFSELEELRIEVLKDGEIIAQDKKMLQLLQMCRRIAKVDTTVLLTGETGVGKEEVASFIHRNSKRSTKAFAKINCGAIPENLIESELFGYEKGAFTGASKDGKMGVFEAVNSGTLFLDEIGELPLNMQVKLLRVLQEREVVRIGGVKPRKIDVRIIAATNRDLEGMIEANEFREDLFYRLNVVPIVIPALRDRRDDIIPLVNHFLLSFNTKYGFKKIFSKDALDNMCFYRWQGNVRELKNMVERLVILSKGDIISAKDLPPKIFDIKVEDDISKVYGTRQESGDISSEITLKEAVGRLEKELIEISYKKYGNVRAAAKALGIDGATFVRKRKKYSEIHRAINGEFTELL